MYVQKIILERQNEAVTEANTTAAKRQESVANNAIKLRSKLNEANIKYKLGLDLTNKTLDESRKLVNASLKAEAKYSINKVRGTSTAINAEARALTEISRIKVNDVALLRKQEVANEAATDAAHFDGAGGLG